MEKSFKILKDICIGSQSWFSKQFQGIRERADTSYVEIRKIPDSHSSRTELSYQIDQNDNRIVSVKEYIYIHFLVCGRNDTVKQLLDQYDTAQSCYRSVGFLAETLLTEPKHCVEDYVQGFSDRITEVY